MELVHLTTKTKNVRASVPLKGSFNEIPSLRGVKCEEGSGGKIQIKNIELDLAQQEEHWCRRLQRQHMVDIYYRPNVNNRPPLFTQS